MLSVRRVLATLAWCLCTGQALGRTVKRDPLPGLVEWDAHSLIVHGERIMMFNGEFHPFRLPVPDLWLDIFQKLKAAGFSGVSFYTDWALYEGKQGNFTANEVLDLQPFFDAASEAGIYLVARPGPYINAEASGGGFPGWLGRTKETERTPAYIPNTQNYIEGICSMLAPAQITNGGPIILLQPENEYSSTNGNNPPFPDTPYMADVEQQYRDNGIKVPFVSNDIGPYGNFAPGTGSGAVDIYGHDGYPLGFDCSDPSSWADNALPTDWWALHEKQSPTTPYTVSEFQGGSLGVWGDTGYEDCAAFLGPEFERVFYKNNYAANIGIMNLYMAFGGTNWGNLGFPDGYTSYDYGAVIAEDRTVAREKYSELKLQTNFFKVSPSYLESTATNASAGAFVSTSDITTTILTGEATNIYVVRQSTYNSEDSTEYTLNVQTSLGHVSVPQLGGTLVLNGRDSKLHVTDYNIGGINMLYSSAEIFTWKQYADRTVLVLYGGANETHEAAFVGQDAPTIIEGSGVQNSSSNGSIIIHWDVTPERKVVQFPSGLYVYLLWRNDAYNYWVLDLAAPAPFNAFSHQNASSVIVSGGYLMRTANVTGNTLALVGDVNATTTLEILGGAPANGSVTFNGSPLDTNITRAGTLMATLSYSAPDLTIPSLQNLTWKYIDSAPEVQNNYSDAAWTDANLNDSNNTIRNLTTPVSLYGSDYGYNVGTLVFRGYFTSNGGESSAYVATQGGSSYGHTVFLNDTLLGSWTSAASNHNQTFSLSGVQSGSVYVLTVYVDNTGLEETAAGYDGSKTPRGILDYGISGHPQSDVTWKITGNLGGEDYVDWSRSPLNEGGLFAERQGYHLPGAPITNWTDGGPFGGIANAGIAFYGATFDLNVPDGYDVPMAFELGNSTSPSAYRAILYVNGWQFGKQVSTIGPQTLFPVPPGILNYKGENYVGLILWALEESGASLGTFNLVSNAQIQSSYPIPDAVSAYQYSPRNGAY